MAAVDKIYGFKHEYDEFKLWCEKNYPIALDYFYNWNYDDDGCRHAMTNFPEKIDRWLVKNCSINYIVKAIHEQYECEI